MTMKQTTTHQTQTPALTLAQIQRMPRRLLNEARHMHGLLNSLGLDGVVRICNDPSWGPTIRGYLADFNGRLAAATAAARA